MDQAIVRGKVTSDPQYVKNGGEIRCHFSVGLEFQQKVYLNGGKTVEMKDVLVGIFAATEPSLTERCRALLSSGDDVVMFGDFGFHKGKLKMVVKGIDLPDIQVLC